MVTKKELVAQNEELQEKVEYLTNIIENNAMVVTPENTVESAEGVDSSGESYTLVKTTDGVFGVAKEQHALVMTQTLTEDMYNLVRKLLSVGEVVVEEPPAPVVIETEEEEEEETDIEEEQEVIVRISDIAAAV